VLSSLDLCNHFIIEHIRDGEIINILKIRNSITKLGKDNLLNTFFNGKTQETFYIGLIDANGFTTTSDDDIITSHPGWSKFIGLSNPVLPDWLATGDLAASQIIQNAAPAVLTFGASGSIAGIYVVSGDNAVLGNIGNLWATSLLNSGDEQVTVGDTFNITYKIQWAV